MYNKINISYPERTNLAITNLLSFFLYTLQNNRLTVIIREVLVSSADIGLTDSPGRFLKDALKVEIIFTSQNYKHFLKYFKIFWLHIVTHNLYENKDFKTTFKV
jgi:hypothetical protein